MLLEDDSGGEGKRVLPVANTEEAATRRETGGEDLACVCVDAI